MPRDFNSEQEIEVARDDARGVLHPIPTVNPLDSDPILRRLIDGRERIVRGWCVNRTCRTDADGKISYCARGAVMTNGTWGGYDATAQKAEAALAAQLSAWADRDPGESVAIFNNQSSSSDVLALFDRAISARRAELEGVK